MDEIGPDARVTYSVRELLAEQTALLRRIDGKVDTKADKSDIAAINSRVDGHENRIKGLEDDRDERVIIASEKARRLRWWWAAATAVVVPLAVALILAFAR